MKKAAITIILIAAVAAGAAYLDSRQDKGGAEQATVYEYALTGMSFAYPEGYSIFEMEEGERDIILVRKDDESTEGFQVGIMPFDEPADSLTFERLSIELPDMNIESPRMEEVHEGTSALVFDTGSDQWRTREAWFVRGGHLYQMSAPVSSAPALEAAIESISFK